jgi:hypothetical protein
MDTIPWLGCLVKQYLLKPPRKSPKTVVMVKLHGGNDYSRVDCVWDHQSPLERGLLPQRQAQHLLSQPLFVAVG